MDYFIDRLEKLDIQTRLNNCVEAREKLENKEGIETDTEALNYIERIKLLVKHVESLMASSDVYLTPFNAYKSVSDNLNQIHSNINAYISNNNRGHLTNVVNQSDALLAALSQFAVPHSTEELESLMESIVSVKRSLGQHRSNIREDGEKIQQYKDESQSLITLIQKYETDIKETKEGLEKDIEEYLAAQQKEFESSKESILEEEKNNYTSEFDELAKGFEDYLTNHKEDLTQKQDEFIKLFNLVTDQGISGEFHKTANEEEKLRKGWTVTTLIGFGVLIVYSVYAFFFHDLVLAKVFEVEVAISWADILKRLALSLALGGFVTYAAKQAADHKREARYNRGVQMKIQSINPYLSNYQEEPEAIQEIKRELANTIFTKEPTLNQNPNHIQNSQIGPNTAVPLESVITLIREIAAGGGNKQ
jgi:hypothetical protein